jgi:hypothetical protein
MNPPPQGPLPQQPAPGGQHPGQPQPAAPQYAPQGPGHPPPPFGGMGGAPLLPQPQIVPQVPRTYRAYYDDIGNDPYAGQYAAIMGEYAVPLDGLNVQPPQVLAQRAYQSASQGIPISFLILSSPPAAAPGHAGHLILMHRVAKFHAVVGMPVHQWSDRAFAFKGDLVQGQLPSVDWDPTYLHQVNGQQLIPTADALTQLLAGDPALSLVGPFQNGEAGTEFVRTRRSMYVPPRYVSIFLEEDLSPRVAYETFLAAATTNNDVGDCAPLLQWLRLALTREAIGGASTLMLVPPSVPLADRTLIQHRWSFVTRDLPVLDPTQAQHGAHYIAASIGALAQEQRTARREDQLRRVADNNKTPAAYYGTGIRTILRLCQVGHESMLPQLYRDLAKAPKRQELGVIQASVDDASAALSVNLSLVVSPSLGKKLATLAWKMSDPNDLSTGIHPFVVGYKTPAERESQLAIIALHQMVMEGGTAPTLQDAQLLISPDHVSLPLTFTAGRYTLMNSLVIQRMGLGANHPLTTELHDFVMAYESHEPMLENYVPPAPTLKAHVPALIVRWVQLRISRWIDVQLLSATAVPTPILGTLFDKMFVGEHWMPTLPAAYWTPAGNQQQPQPQQQQQQQLPPPPPGQDAAPPAADNRITNERFNPIFQEFRDVAAIKTRQIYQRAAAAGVDLPTRASDGRERCLAFHLKGMCNLRCGRAYDHTIPPAPPPVPADEQSLQGWCRQHWHV